MKRLNLRLLEVFRVVFESRSITVAAGRLGVTQPAVSKALAEFEQDVGLSLFGRQRRRLVPTEDAARLYDETARHLELTPQQVHLRLQESGMEQPAPAEAAVANVASARTIAWTAGSANAANAANATNAADSANTANSFVLTEKAHVAVEGLDDVAVIATEDAVYVGKLSEAQKVGQMVKTLRGKADTQTITEIHRTAYRPWGGYSSVLNGARFQVKRLFVKPGKKLSLQKHHHRAEHWVVVSGTAEVTIDGKVSMLTENESIYLPLGCVHRLTNPGKILLELIEVQTGSYLGEDDIIRIEDEFGRA